MSEAGTPRLPFPPVMVGISGASGSGKTTLAAELARTLGGLHFSLDTYYRDLSHLPMEERARVNFDDPAMIELPLLAGHIEALSQGKPILRPGYSFAEYIRLSEQNERIEPGPLVVVEGLFALYFSELRAFYQLSVYVDTADDLCFQRRLKRDVEERGREPESVRRQYEATVRPCGLAFVRPLADVADLSVDGADQLDFKVEQIRNTMKRRGLLSRIGTPS
ncbi:uridine kinase [Acidicapsa dinghuensis]|uniref:uridine/cytidine kinase n=1 Tax=Acidicapsa dinghuensis TaxID=2218256 RepID=A0ABW1EHI2_9BACT|nr:uridine kinase [Acidicapsa dinghuensis]